MRGAEAAGVEAAPGVRWLCVPLALAEATPVVAAAGLVAADQSEAERAAAFTSASARRDFLAGRLLTRALAPALAAELPGVRDASARLSVAHECPRCGEGAHGRPRLLERGRAGAEGQPARELAALSLSRCAGWLLLAAAAPGMRLGVDLVDAADPAHGGRDGALAWAAAEAEGKATGAGIAGLLGAETAVGVPAGRMPDGDGLSVAREASALVPRLATDARGIPRIPGALLAALSVL